MVYLHPTLPLRIGEPENPSNNTDDYIGSLSPRDLELMKMTATNHGFKDHHAYYASLMSNFPTKCAFLYQKLAQCEKSPTSQCDRVQQSFNKNCAGAKFAKVSEDFQHDKASLEMHAKLRGMDTVKFLEYASKERLYCKELCEKCQNIPDLPPRCPLKKSIKDGVNKYCGSYVSTYEQC